MIHLCIQNKLFSVLGNGDTLANVSLEWLSKGSGLCGAKGGQKRDYELVDWNDLRPKKRRWGWWSWRAPVAVGKGQEDAGRKKCQRERSGREGPSEHAVESLMIMDPGQRAELDRRWKSLRTRSWTALACSSSSYLSFTKSPQRPFHQQNLN